MATNMSNLGFYQVLTTISKKVGGPEKLVAGIAVGGYAVLRSGEAGLRWVARAVEQRNAPCATKGQVFRATLDGEESGLKIHVGDEYQVLECDGDAILIEVLDDPDNPYFVSSEFLEMISNFPHHGLARSE